MKKCSQCNEEKEDSEFYKDARVSDGVKSYCKVCAQKYSDRQRKQEYWSRPEVKQARRIKNLKDFYDLTLEQFYEMLVFQDYKCFICGDEISPEIPRGAGSVCIDHNHITGKTRKLLCSGCNAGIGMFKEDIEILNKAIQYLLDHM